MALSSPSTYGSAFAGVALLWFLAPPAAIVMFAAVMMNLADEWASQPLPPEPVEREGHRPSDGYECRCHRRMGNDFWFLPKTSCLYGRCNKDD